MKRAWSAALSLSCLFPLSLFATDAHANGRFPGANHLVFGPADPSLVAVRTTFGALVSRDAGATFRWVCEEAVGYAGQQDPAIALFADGTLATAALEGAFVSHDGGCSHQRLTADTSVDFTVARADATRGLLLTSTFVKGVHEARLLRSTDSGHSFTPLSMFDASFYPDTVDYAPSAIDRVYVSGTFSDGTKLQGAVDRSDDGGVSWKRQVFDLGGDSGVFIAAVDPQSPDRVYVRTTGKTADRLLVSDDGGATFSTRASAEGGLLGFALSPDGAEVAIGGPSIGVRVASRADLAFSQANAVPVSCLAWGTDGLWACGAGADFALGRSTDGGATFAPVLSSLAAICGPLLDCPAESGFDATCGPRWAATAANFGGEGDTCGPVGAAGMGGSAGSSGASGGLAGGAGGATGGAAADPPSPTATPARAEDGGCAVTGDGSSSRLPAGVALGFLVAGLAFRRSKRQRT